jgi:hypothetical protein
MNTLDQASSRAGRTPRELLRLIFSSDTALVVFSGALFLASVANATHGRMLRSFQFCGICTTLLSVTFLLLTGHELIKQEQRRKRTIAATTLFLLATLICIHGMKIVREY